jgi:hypothetical protein
MYLPKKAAYKSSYTETTRQNGIKTQHENKKYKTA